MSGISVTTSSNSAAANGSTTVFNFTFFVYNTDQIKVYRELNDVLTEVTSGITKTINANNIGGTVTFSTAPLAAAGDVLIRREVAYTQETEFADITRYKESAIEEALNTLVMQIQQIKAQADLSVRYRETAGTTDPTIATPTAGSVLIFDGTTGKISAATLASLSTVNIDTTFSSLASADFFVYNGTAWTNRTFKDVLDLLADVSPATGDKLLIRDASDSNNPKECLVSEVLALSSSAGRVLAVNVFTASGTWTKPAGCTAAEVWVVGGGGGGAGDAAGSAGSAGGTSSFGSHCSATGGSAPAANGTRNNPGAGGTGSGGDININGQRGGNSIDGEASTNNSGCGGDAPFGFGYGAPFAETGQGAVQGTGYGSGGSANISSATQTSSGGGGGGGAYKYITSSLGATETVTVGAGGAGGAGSGATGAAGKSGIVIVISYS